MAKLPLSPTKPSIWLQLYFVLASLLGLVLLVIGVSSLVNTLLITTVFKVKSYQSAPPQPYMMEKVPAAQQEQMTAEQRQAYAQWQQDYDRWQKEEKGRDYEQENRRRSMAWAIALILTGAPVFALHAPFVFRQARG